MSDLKLEIDASEIREVLASFTETLAMFTENQVRISQGLSVAYSEDELYNMADKIRGDDNDV